ncbi:MULTISPECIES: hypothetical protein [Dyella]|uniref:Thioredoxin domain-containing protein n=2 Tax=Dyella TaxID=231454 RepID=A0A4R0YIM0_9GAMM|nr:MULTISPECIES: hypothetical protein [Dyella]TBR36670.1 hypothetical protein EYV96_12145 [Dyella terrae]TCI08239.1 hypothetical protein EZM97_26725 [Dyella soli]
MNQPANPAQRSSRLKLILVMAVFIAPILAAGLLTLSGWQPTGKANGLPITPQRNFEEEKLRVQTATGSDWAWRNAEPQLTLIAMPGPGCAAHCVETLNKMAAARVTLNRNAPRLRLLLVGDAPAVGKVEKGAWLPDANVDFQWQLGTDVDAKLASWRATQPDSVSALLVESNGTALALYPEGFDPTGLRKDLQKVIR